MLAVPLHSSGKTDGLVKRYSHQLSAAFGEFGSDYNSVYSIIAKKSMRRAELVDNNLSIAKAIKKIMIGIEIFASEHGCKPDDLDVTTKMTFDGRIIVTLRRS